MSTTAPLACFIPAYIDACALYRMFMPHLHIPRSRFVFNLIKTPVSVVAEADVAIVQRQCTPANMEAMNQMKKMGMKIIYDLDDDLWSVQGPNPAKRIFDAMKHGFGPCIEMCDMVTVSTGRLGTAVKTSVPAARNIPIHVIPNAIDFDYFRAAPLKKDDDTVVIGWGGSNTHSADITVAWKVLPEIMELFPNVRMEFIGHNPPKPLIGHERVKMRQWAPVGEFPVRYATWSWDIVLAPLDDNRFNRSKSCIKALEAAAIGSPCLMSPVEPYINFCAHDEDLKWLLCKGSYEWREKLIQLVQHAELRKYYAEIMSRVTLEHYQSKTNAQLWQDAFTEVCKQ